MRVVKWNNLKEFSVHVTYYRTFLFYKISLAISPNPTISTEGSPLSLRYRLINLRLISLLNQSSSTVILLLIHLKLVSDEG